MISRSLLKFSPNRLLKKSLSRLFKTRLIFVKLIRQKNSNKSQIHTKHNSSINSTKLTKISMTSTSEKQKNSTNPLRSPSVTTEILNKCLTKQLSTYKKRKKLWTELVISRANKINTMKCRLNETLKKKNREKLEKKEIIYKIKSIS